MINPETIIDYASGAAYRHTPPGDAPLAGKLMTTERVTLDSGLSQRLLDDGYLGDRSFDGLLDQRIVALANPDGSGNRAEIERLISSEPELGVKLERLRHDTTWAAQLAAEAAVRGCFALDA